MKKYKVFVDSNGKDSLWFCAGEKVENPLVLEKQEIPKCEPSVEELNGEILMRMFNLTGLLKNVKIDATYPDSHRINLEESLPNQQLKIYTLDIHTVDVKTVHYSKQVPPQLRVDGGYNY